MLTPKGRRGQAGVPAENHLGRVSRAGARFPRPATYPGKSVADLVLRTANDRICVCRYQRAYVELASATFRAARGGDIPSEDVPGVLAAIRNEWDNFVRIPADDSLIQEAAGLAQKHPIRAYDAMHLAAALRRRSLPEGGSSIPAFDKELLAAARSEGLVTAPEPRALPTLSAPHSPHHQGASPR